LELNIYATTIPFIVLSGKEESNPLDDPVLFCDGCFAMIRKAALEYLLMWALLLLNVAMPLGKRYIKLVKL
jgi:hypothetical protein